MELENQRHDTQSGFLNAFHPRPTPAKQSKAKTPTHRAPHPSHPSPPPQARWSGRLHRALRPRQQLLRQRSQRAARAPAPPARARAAAAARSRASPRPAPAGAARGPRRARRAGCRWRRRRRCSRAATRPTASMRRARLVPVLVRFRMGGARGARVVYCRRGFATSRRRSGGAARWSGARAR